MTTARIGEYLEKACIPTCPAGYYFDRIGKICESCGLRGFQPDEGSDECIPCPQGYVPIYKNSTSVDHCLEACPAGSERDASLKCSKCPVGSFKSLLDPVCMMCPTSTTTISEGAKSLTECDMQVCDAGSYLQPETAQCLSCPFGSYTEGKDARECKKCPSGSTTYEMGAISLSQCQPTDQCRAGTHKCHWLAACFDLPDTGNTPRYSCKCRPGFVGNGFNCTDACEGLCLNDSECLKTSKGATKCICKAGYLGRRCEKRIFSL